MGGRNMAMSPSAATIARKKAELERKTGEEYVVLRASNGEVAILAKSYVDSCHVKAN
jgi:hypothetical protein